MIDSKYLWAAGGLAVGVGATLLIQGNKISDLWSGIRRQEGTPAGALPVWRGTKALTAPTVAFQTEPFGIDTKGQAIVDSVAPSPSQSPSRNTPPNTSVFPLLTVQEAEEQYRRALAALRPYLVGSVFIPRDAEIRWLVATDFPQLPGVRLASREEEAKDQQRFLREQSAGRSGYRSLIPLAKQRLSDGVVETSFLWPNSSPSSGWPVIQPGYASFVPRNISAEMLMELVAHLKVAELQLRRAFVGQTATFSSPEK